MENLPAELIPILQFLLPGFITALVFYNLTSHSKPPQFERIILALIFTLFIRLLVSLSKLIFLYAGNFVIIGSWGPITESFWSIIISIFIGIIFAFISNRNYVHGYLSKIGVTTETSYASVWVGVLSKHETYVVLHLQDERRLYGWPKDWPSDPTSGHFNIWKPAWLVSREENGSEVTEKQPINGVSAMLIRATDVKWVEFMEFQKEKKNATE
ncbi:MAG: hypothetical protein COA84_09190 [Robiginitomaculum sp.]|nr:MAG: hypothetical protein COA84_09190 [Robiginitomaculum sp.]